jgi:hypothetical protein
MGNEPPAYVRSSDDLAAMAIAAMFPPRHKTRCQYQTNGLPRHDLMLAIQKLLLKFQQTILTNRALLLIILLITVLRKVLYCFHSVIKP